MAIRRMAFFLFKRPQNCLKGRLGRKNIDRQMLSSWKTLSLLTEQIWDQEIIPQLPQEDIGSKPPVGRFFVLWRRGSNLFADGLSQSKKGCKPSIQCSLAKLTGARKGSRNNPSAPTKTDGKRGDGLARLSTFSVFQRSHAA